MDISIYLSILITVDTNHTHSGLSTEMPWWVINDMSYVNDMPQPKWAVMLGQRSVCQ